MRHRHKKIEDISNSKTIKEVVDNNLCTGCGTCFGLCPTSAIQITRSESRGIYIPLLDKESCTQCGICFDACPGHCVDFKRLNLDIFNSAPADILIGNYSGCYTGYAADPQIRYHSASGGLITALLSFALEQGAINGALVTKMSDQRPLEPVSFIAKTKEDIICAATSKYCPVPINIALKEILDRKAKYAVVGLPCHIQSLRKAEQISTVLRERVVMHFGLVCNHTPSFLAMDYLLQSLGVPKNAVKGLSYRGAGWPGQMTITVADGSTKTVPYHSVIYWGNIFNKFFYPIRCTTCNDKICELADISFMDAWPYVPSDDETGKSMIVVRSQTGQNLLMDAMAAKAIELKKTTGDTVIQSQGLINVTRRHYALIALHKRFGMEIPIYGKPCLNAGLIDYLQALSLCLQTYISSKRRYWFLVGFYSTIWQLARFLKRQIIKVISYLPPLFGFKRVN